MKQSDNTNRTPANWDGTPQEDYFADWNTPPEEYPAAGRHLSPEAREEYYAERDAYYARRDAYYAQRDAYYAQREREERAADEKGEEYEEEYGEDYADDADEPEEEEDDVSYAPEDRAETLEEPKEKPKKKKRRRKGGFLRFLVTVIVLAIVALVVIGKAPVRNPDNLERISGRSTVLLCGTDEDGMRTDTILLLTLDRNEGSIRLLSIPRDTYAPAYYVPKINSAYGAVGGGEKGMEQLMEQVKNVVGFMPDGYALVNLSAFVEAVDLLGGLDFDVPMDMDYDDPDQNLFIHLKAGEQHLTGEQLMWVVRFRSGYANADIGRTEVQRAVMKTAMKQWLRPKTLAALPGLWRIYQENLTTDLSVRNIVWMARVLLKGMSGDIEANVLPGYATMAGDASVYMIDTYAASAILPDYSPYKLKESAPAAAGAFCLVRVVRKTLQSA